MWSVFASILKTTAPLPGPSTWLNRSVYRCFLCMHAFCYRLDFLSCVHLLNQRNRSDWLHGCFLCKYHIITAQPNACAYAGWDFADQFRLRSCIALKCLMFISLRLLQSCFSMANLVCHAWTLVYLIFLIAQPHRVLTRTPVNFHASRTPTVCMRRGPAGYCILSPSWPWWPSRDACGYPPLPCMYNFFYVAFLLRW